MFRLTCLVVVAGFLAADELLAQGPVHLVRLGKGEYDKENQAGYLHATE